MYLIAVSFMARELLEGATKRFFLAGLAIVVTVVGIGTTCTLFVDILI